VVCWDEDAVYKLKGAARWNKVTVPKLLATVYKLWGAVPKLRATVCKLCGAVCWNEPAVWKNLDAVPHNELAARGRKATARYGSSIATRTDIATRLTPTKARLINPMEF